MLGVFGIARPGAELDPIEVQTLGRAAGGIVHESASAAIITAGSAGSFTAAGGIRVAGEAHLVGGSELAARFGTSDPLAIAAELYRHDGSDGLARLQGQFCLALHDAPNRRLVLVTDRFATRPIYYRQHSGALHFGSRLAPVAGDAVIDGQAILEYLHGQAIPAPRTPFIGVSKLPAAHFLIADEGGVNVRPYWDMTYPESRNGSASFWAGRLRGEIEAAVGRYVEAEGSLDSAGSFLSGGTDSSTIAGLLSRSSPRPVKTFSIGYAEEGYDELFYAHAASRWFGTLQHDWRLSPAEALDSLPAIVDYYEEPFGNASALPTYRCAQLARENGVRVLFAGDGGDELFAGNERYATDKVFSLYRRIPRPIRRALTDPLLTSLPVGLPGLGRACRYVRRSNIPNPRRIFSYSLLLSQPLDNLLTADFLASIDPKEILAVAEAHFRRPAPGTSELNRLLYLDLKMAIVDNDLRKVGGMAELAGIEVRYPFLDTGLAELSGLIPTHLKLHRFEKRYIFKRALADFLPPEVLSKRKHGFGAPVAVWMRTDRRWREFAGDLLHDPRTIQRGYVRPSVLESLWQQIESGGPSYYGDTLWPLLMLELWHRRHAAGRR
jgi:asparagine synthase (glutamine-hydrolysing)